MSVTAQGARPVFASQIGVWALNGSRMLWGAVLITCPGGVFRLLAGAPSDVRSRTLARILGGRHLLQGLAAAHRRRIDPAWDPAIDAAHSFSTLLWGAFDARRRRPALTDAAIAAGFAMRSRRVGTASA